MARQSTIKTMKTVSALLVLVVAGLIIAGVAKLRHDYYLEGTQLVGWAFVPLALLLGFAWPTRCKVKKTNRKACGNWAYGFLFGCTKAAGHWTATFLVRLGFKRDEARPVERRQPSGNTVVFNQPVPHSKPAKVTVEESALAKCGFWVGLAAGIVGIIQAIISLVH
jgi:hypothetical protein